MTVVLCVCGHVYVSMCVCDVYMWRVVMCDCVTVIWLGGCECGWLGGCDVAVMCLWMCVAIWMCGCVCSHAAVLL